MNIYDKRWAKVSQYANKLKELYDTGKYVLMYDEEICEKANIIIDEKFKKFYISLNQGQVQYKYQLFDGDPSWDDGAHDKISDTLERFNETIKLFEMKSIKI